MLAVVPFLNQNNSFLLNPAMAQEYDKYRDSYYSQYQTDDNKYQCRTRPFEGFFVSSVEFCKHVKFDDRKDNSRDNNQTGAQGPPGPQGPQGIQGLPGATGPAGINVINGSNSYPVIGDLVAVNNTGDRTFSDAICDDGDIAITGSFSVVPVNDSSIGSYDLRFFGPTGLFPSGSWNTIIVGEADTLVQTMALCFDNPPAHRP